MAIATPEGPLPAAPASPAARRWFVGAVGVADHRELG